MSDKKKDLMLYAKEKILRSGLFWLGALAILIMFSMMSPEVVTVSSSSGRKLPIYCVDTEKPQVAISFDAAWGNEDTAQLLSILEKQGVHATFFMTGGWIEKYPEDVKRIAEAGHDLGNHSENHKQMSQISKEECIAELKKPHEKVKKLTGKDMILFRPPYGDYNNTLIEAANEIGYHVIQWDVDSLDWKDYGTEAIVDKVLNHKHLGNGSIILMHNGAKYTKDALETVITGLKEKGFELVPISELIYKENYEMDHEGRQFVKKAAMESKTIHPAIGYTAPWIR